MIFAKQLLAKNNSENRSEERNVCTNQTKCNSKKKSKNLCEYSPVSDFLYMEVILVSKI